MKRKKIAIAMSGGVDSTACALLLKDHHDISGFFMKLDQPDYQEQFDRVNSIANKLGISLTVIDLKDQFTKNVLDYFSSSYKNGLTPNPCVVCNREIKFGLFMDGMLANDCDYVATGHYAKITQTENIFHLEKGKDPRKDQSYFLSRLSQSQLSKVIFPLGDMEKNDIYDYVHKHGFTDFKGKESQDVCFLNDGKIGKYLEDECGLTAISGDITNSNGKKLGRHNGLHNYTVGQRKGLGISDATPYYVIGLHPDSNRVIVGKNDELFMDTLHLKNLHWICGTPPNLEKEYLVRIRYTHKGAMAKIAISQDDCSVSFTEPQRGITPGQFGVIYHNDEVIGSGVIA